MPSFVFNSCVEDAVSGNIDFKSDTIMCLLVPADYVPNKATSARRSDITDETTGPGYTSGGTLVPVTVTNDPVYDRIDILLGTVSWPGATITAGGAVYYKSRGGAATEDPVIAFIDFGGATYSHNGTFRLNQSIIRLNN